MKIITDCKDSSIQATLYTAKELKFVVKPGDFISSVGNVVDPVWTFYYASSDKIYPLDVTEYQGSFSIDEFDEMNDNPEYFEDLSINCIVFEGYDRKTKKTKTNIRHLDFNKNTLSEIVEHDRSKGPGHLEGKTIKEDTLENCLMYYYKKGFSNTRGPGTKAGFWYDFDTKEKYNAYTEPFVIGDTIKVELRQFSDIEFTIISMQKEFKDGIQKLTYNLTDKKQLIIYNDLYYKTMSFRDPLKAKDGGGCFIIEEVIKINKE